MKDIYKYLCIAQIASDGGKGIEDLKSFNPNAWMKGYEIKDREIMRAINEIKRGKGDNSHFAVHFDYYSRRLDVYVFIVYFKLKNGMQMSFHVFDWKGEYIKLKDGFHRTRWDHRLNGSRETARFLLENRGI